MRELYLFQQLSTQLVCATISNEFLLCFLSMGLSISARLKNNGFFYSILSIYVNHKCGSYHHLHLSNAQIVDTLF